MKSSGKNLPPQSSTSWDFGEEAVAADVEIVAVVPLGAANATT